MAEKKDATVTLVAPNGVSVSVNRDKLEERIAGGYRLPEKRASARTSSAADK